MPQTATALSREEFEQLTPDEQEELNELDEDGAGGEGLAEFIRRLSPHHPPPQHFLPVIEALERARTEQMQVCISMPPRHGKTTLLQHAFAWWLSKYPADTNAYFSYNEKQGRSKGGGPSRKLSERAGIELDDEIASKSEWRTEAGGGLIAGGVGGGLTGQGVSGLMVVDDPFKNREEADSQIRREAVWEWFTEVVMTRLEGASVFVVHTRWHEDDLIGRLSKLEDWVVINLPAIAEEDDPMGRAEGEALWPDRYSAEYLNRLRGLIGEFSFAALYQGRPRPRGAMVFNGAHYFDLATFDPKGCRIILAADPAASDDTSADYSAAVALAIRGNDPATMMGYVLEVYRYQVTVPQFVNDLLAFQNRNWKGPIHVEAIAGFRAVPQMLKAINPQIRLRALTKISGDKFLRAQPAAAAWNGARILVPTDAPWLADFLDEVGHFTGVKDAHDDQVDALSHAWNGATGAASFVGPSVSVPRRS